jgi:hypothetical protein
MKDWSTFLVGMFFGMISTGILMNIFIEKSKVYVQGVKDTHKEAFEHGLMTKEITKDGEVIYRWRETHDLGYKE